ncbi:glycosyltransferase family 2 protein [Aquiflexum sp. LQ15W]|uniref:glycosyltransferase family 2 protein n=1 Tax=Cognataquiflexum nitidum TaxID=2922272 RepID=UPI001F143DA2|nr:glycosyltransferase family 2 protein [Cognataquiflexum nitidum]MCH6201339.1 glycosyltransferase family 2 protein [Cognataquiflexum nitidum]
MLVSIIIPLYNCADSFQRTMQSVLAQTYNSIEVILVDDGSTDKSYDAAKQYESNRVFVLQQKNAGAAVARNTGLAIAKGDYIQFLDAGDVLGESKITVQVRALQVQPRKVAVSTYKQFTTKEEIANGVYPDQSDFIYSSDDPQDFLVNLWGEKGHLNFIQTNCWLVPRALIEKAGHWRNYRCPDDDGEFFARVLLASDGIVYTPGVYNYYHIAPGGQNQLSRSTNRKYLMNTLLTIALKHDYLKAYGAHSRLNSAIAAQYYRFAIDMFPTQKRLSAIAWRRFKAFREKPPKLVLGGFLIQIIAKLFGWRTARLVRYYLRGS